MARSVLTGSAEQVVTLAYGQPDFGHLDGDGVVEAALIILHSTGGSGTVFLGDRITVQSIQILNCLL